MLYMNTPVGRFSVPSWLDKEISPLSNEELIERALAENNSFCISPQVYAMIEKRGLEHELQRKINASFARKL